MLNTMINVRNGLLYTVEQKIFNLDFEKFTNSEMKFRASKFADRNLTNLLVKMSKNGILGLSADHCLRYFDFEKESSLKKTSVLGFVCPYCLSVFSSFIALNQNHLDVHLGPVSCQKCKVIFFHNP